MTEAEELELLELEEEEARAAAGGPSGERSAVLGAAQGGTFGFADEIGGLVGKLFVPESGVKPGPAARPTPTDTPEQAELKADLNKPQPSSYQLTRDSVRTEAKQGEKQHPWAYGAGELAGGIASSFVAPGSVYAQGAVQGLGSSEAENLKGAIVDAGTGALWAKGGELLGKGLGKGAKGVGNAVKRVAERRAVKAAGAIQNDIRRLADKGTLQKLGRFILDKKLIPKRAIVGLGGPDAIAERAGKAVKESGEQVGSTLKELDTVAPDAIDPAAIASKVDEELISPLRGQLGTEATEAKLAKLAEGLKQIRPGLQRGEIGAASKAGLSFTEAEEALKRPLDQKINFNKLLPERAEPARQVRGLIKREIEERAKETSPELAEKFIQAKGDYGLAREVQGLTDKQIARELGNLPVGLTDLLAANAGGVGPGLVFKAIKDRGSAAIAPIADALGDAIRSNNTAEVARLLGVSGGRMVQEKFGRFREAMSRGQ